MATDEQPEPRRGKQAKAPQGIPLRSQIELLYRAGGTLARSRAPLTAQAIHAQAGACAAAWDQFLLRYPALREALEKGMIAGDILGLVMAHVPIMQAMRMEMEMRRAPTELFGEGTDADQGRHVAA